MGSQGKYKKENLNEQSHFLKAFCAILTLHLFEGLTFLYPLFCATKYDLSLAAIEINLSIF